MLPKYGGLLLEYEPMGESLPKYGGQLPRCVGQLRRTRESDGFLKKVFVVCAGEVFESARPSLPKYEPAGESSLSPCSGW